MKFVSLFAGVGGFDLGMERAGHECVAQVEWDKNAAGVLKRRWPDVPLFCDVSKVRGEDFPECDFLTYGFPCQDLSVAGKREGLDGKRSGLFYEATRLIRELVARGSRFRFALAENVAGLFSADDGLAFARCIRELLESGASEIGWRVLDSQYFGVAQRRRRVFIVADLRGQSAEKVFSIKASLPGHPAPKRKTRGGTARNVRTGFAASSFGGYEQGCGTLRSQGGDLGGGSETLLTQGADVYNGELTGEVACTLTSGTGDACRTGPKLIEGPCYENHSGDSRITDSGNTCPTLTKRIGTGGGNLPLVKERNLSVRRLTPKECERLQGFPADWTLERAELVLDGNEWKGTGKIVKQADGPRYRQMGNAVTVNVAEWIGEQMTEAIK